MPIIIFIAALIFSTASFPQDASSTDTSSSIDLSAPDLQTPSQQDTPSAGGIFAPLVNLIPSISGFTMPQHESTCYAPVIDLAVTTFTLDAPCNLIEPNRSVIALVAVLMWSIAAFLIIMGA